MIGKDEIMAVADEKSLTLHVVEKDYVLGWLLAAINNNSVLSQSWAFKGGTCLKKCYFETYRFSEDLDFTLRDKSHIDEKFLKEQFSAMADWIYRETGIEIPPGRLKFDIYPNKRGHSSCEGSVYYKSYFSSGKHSYPRVKFDLTSDEVVVMPLLRRTVFHPYADQPQDGIFIESYDYPEVFGEKVRALGERCRPRDLYDVVNLFRRDCLPPPAIVRNILSQKCDYKNINVPKLIDMDAHKDGMQQNWAPMLEHQLPILPDLDAFWGSLPEFFEWLESEKTQVKAQLKVISKDGRIYQRPYGYGFRKQKALSSNALEIIRFAASNRLCVNLDYTNNEGYKSSREIEPYSLREAQNGNILLHAVRVDNGQSRSYKIEQINDASITNRVFAPRFHVELSSSDVSDLVVQKTLPKTSHHKNEGPTYVYRCPMCNKTFKRKTQNSKINSHKRKDGWPCSGRMGHYVKMVY